MRRTGTVEIAYLKRRARGAEHKRLRVRDGGLEDAWRPDPAADRGDGRSPCATIPARAFGSIMPPARSPPAFAIRRQLVDAWTRRHGIVDDDGRPLRLLLSRLRKTHKALWYLKTEGHMARFAVGHTPEVAARHYADIPALRPLHEQTVAEALKSGHIGPQRRSC